MKVTIICGSGFRDSLATEIAIKKTMKKFNVWVLVDSIASLPPRTLASDFFIVPVSSTSVAYTTLISKEKLIFVDSMADTDTICQKLLHVLQV